MKKITSTVRYTVPHWNFCNIDHIDLGCTVPKKLCNFCERTKEGYRCLLYNKSLSSNDGLVDKTKECCKATAGFASNIDTTSNVPTIPPKELMKQAIDLYVKTVEDLVNQGYPRQIANTAAKKHVLGD